MRIPKTINTLYVAKDYSGIYCFIDFPDLLKIYKDSIPEWTGYVFDFENFPELKQCIFDNELVKSLKELDAPLKVIFDKKTIYIDSI